MAPKHRPKHAAPSRFSLAGRRPAPKRLAPADGGSPADRSIRGDGSADRSIRGDGSADRSIRGDGSLGDGSPTDGSLRPRSDFSGRETIEPRPERPAPSVLEAPAPNPGRNGRPRPESRSLDTRAFDAGSHLDASDFGRSGDDFWNEARPRRRSEEARRRGSGRTSVLEPPSSDPLRPERPAGSKPQPAAEAPAAGEPVRAAGSMTLDAQLREEAARMRRAAVEEPKEDPGERPAKSRRKKAAGEVRAEGRPDRDGRPGKSAAPPGQELSERRRSAWHADAAQLENEVREGPYARPGKSKVDKVVPSRSAGTASSATARHPRHEGSGESQSLGQWFKEITILGIVAVGTAVLLTTYLVQAFFIPSGSMENTLVVGDRVLVNKFAYKMGEPALGDIVVFASPEGERAAPPANTPFAKFMDKVAIAIGLKSSEQDLIKRVIATGGQTVEGKLGLVFVDGRQLDEPYRKTTDPIPDFGPTQVPADHVFVMGDNRLNSKDSREFGSIPLSTVVGKAFARIWPLDRADWFNE